MVLLGCHPPGAQQTTQSSRGLKVFTGGGPGRKAKATQEWSSWDDRDEAASESIQGHGYPAAAPMPAPVEDNETSDGWFRRDNLQRAKKSAG